MLTPEALLLGVVAGLVVGLSKTAIPGAGLLAIPLIAAVADGRRIAGASLPILILADVFAVSFYRSHARWDLLRPLAPRVATGFVLGIGFYLVVGSSVRAVEVTIGVIVLLMVVVQSWRMIRGSPVGAATAGSASLYGVIGGFTTFVSNSAGPVMNTYLVRIGLDKHEQVGTSAWFYFIVNLTKIPFYLVLGWSTTGGPFFTAETLKWNLIVAPAIIAGVNLGRVAFRFIPQQAFTVAVLVLSAVACVNLLL